jgi:hypothetical protein
MIRRRMNLNKKEMVCNPYDFANKSELEVNLYDAPTNNK